MTIPRFSAQVGQIQIPSMQNYQEKENASIAKSLSDFGSSILHTSVQVGLAEKKAQQTQAQKAKDEMEEFRLGEMSQATFNAETYNKVFEGLSKIAEETKDNPAEYTEKANAFLSGVLSSSTAGGNSASEKIVGEVNKAYQTQANEVFEDNQISSNAKAITDNIYKADNLVQSTTKLSPSIQNKMFSLYIGNLRAQNMQAIANGVITAEQAERNIDTAIKNYASEQYRLSMTSDELSSEQKMSLRESVVLGKTGNDAIDKRMTYEERQNMVSFVDSSIQSGIALNKQISENNEKMRADAFEKDVAKASIYFSTQNVIAQDERNKILDSLAQRAVTKEEAETVIKLRGTGFKDVSAAVDNLELAKFEGVLTPELLKNYWNTNQISNKKYAEYQDYMSTPLFSNQQSSGYKNAVEMIKAKYPIVDKGKVNIFYNPETQETGSVGGSASEKAYVAAMKQLNDFSSETTAITSKDYLDKVKAILAETDKQFTADKKEQERATKEDINVILTGTRYNYDGIESDFKSGLSQEEVQKRIYIELKKTNTKEEARKLSEDVLKLYLETRGAQNAE